MVLLIILCILILFLSFLASSMEAALFTVSSLRIEQMLRKKLPGAVRLKLNKEKVRDSIVAIVFLNNVANVAGSILVGAIASEVFNSFWIGIFSAGFTLAIIFFGEIIPKMIGERFAEDYGRHTAGIVYFLRIAFKPLLLLTKAFVKPFGSARNAHENISEDEITLLSHLGHRIGTILEFENQLIHNVFHLNDTLARDIMTPRTVVFALSADLKVSDIAQQLYSATVSRIPVYEEDIDQVIGVVHLRDLLSALAKGQAEKTIRQFASDVSFIPDTAKADSLLKAFQKNREHIAIVVDEYGGTAGVITLEDILELLVGEIVDEYDTDVDLRLKARIQTERRKKSS